MCEHESLKESITRALTAFQIIHLRHTPMEFPTRALTFSLCLSLSLVQPLFRAAPRRRSAAMIRSSVFPRLIDNQCIWFPANQARLSAARSLASRIPSSVSPLRGSLFPSLSPLGGVWNVSSFGCRATFWENINIRRGKKRFFIFNRLWIFTAKWSFCWN